MPMLPSDRYIIITAAALSTGPVCYRELSILEIHGFVMIRWVYGPDLFCSQAIDYTPAARDGLPPFTACRCLPKELLGCGCRLISKSSRAPSGQYAASLLSAPSRSSLPRTDSDHSHFPSLTSLHLPRQEEAAADRKQDGIILLSARSGGEESSGRDGDRSVTAGDR